MFKVEGKKKEVIDLSQFSSKEELNKLAKICEKLNYVFKKNKNENDKNEEQHSLKK